MKQIKHINICMGSSCFARGNSENLEYIEEYIKVHNLEIKVELTGSRCENKCSCGPNIIIDGNEYTNVTPEVLKEIFENE